jgi:hypothetical protein
MLRRSGSLCSFIFLGLWEAEADYEVSTAELARKAFPVPYKVLCSCPRAIATGTQAEE